MFTSIKKVAVVGLAALVLIGPMPVSASTNAELQAQLNALIVQLTQLQAAASAQGNTSYNRGGNSNNGNGNGCSFTRTIRIGNRGTDVSCLQGYLIEEGYLKVSASGYFGTLSSAAVRAWQVDHELASTGTFGRDEQAAYNATYTNDENNQNDNTPVYTPPVSTIPVCAQVLKQCWNGTYVSYKPGTCTYYDCPSYVPPTTYTPPVVIQPVVSQNSSFNGVSVAAGANASRLASFVVTAGTQPLNISSLTFDKDFDASMDLQNMYIMVGGYRVSGVHPTINDAEDFITFNFTSPLTVAARALLYIDVYADLLLTSAVGSHISVFDSTGWSATDSMTGAFVAFPGAVSGQDVYIVAPGTSSIGFDLNSAFANPSVTVGGNNQRIASFRVTAGSAESMQVGSLTFAKIGTGFEIQNLRIMINGSQFATSRAVISSNESAITFSGYSSITVPAGGSLIIDLYADVLSSSTVGLYSSPMSLIGWTALGSVSGASMSSSSFHSGVSGQNVTVVTPSVVSGASVSANSGFANPSYAVGDTYKKIASFGITAPTSQSVTVGSLTLAKYGNTSLGLQNMKIMLNGSSQFGTTRATVGTTESSLVFSSANPVTVQASGSVFFDVYADILSSSAAATYQSVISLVDWSVGGAVSGSMMVFPGTVSGQNIIVH